MKQIYKDILKAVIVLASIALISGVLLGIVYHLTRLTEKDKLDRIKKDLPEVYAAEDYEGIVFEGAANYMFKVVGEDNTYILQATGGGGYKGDVTMYIVIKENQIIKLKAGTNNESPGISDKAFSDEYYNKFYDTDITKQPTFSVDAASGATYSSTAIQNAVNKAVTHFNDYLKSKGVN